MDFSLKLQKSVRMFENEMLAGMWTVWLPGVLEIAFALASWLGSVKSSNATRNVLVSTAGDTY